MKYQSKLDKTFEVVGIPRSGQHAIATWLMANLPSPSLFLNNSTCIRPDEIWYKNGRRVTNGIHEKPAVFGVGIEGQAHLADKTSSPSVFVVRDIKNHIASLMCHKTLPFNSEQFFKHWEEYALLGLVEIDKPYDYLVIPFSSWHCSRPLREDHFEFFRKLINLEPGPYNDDARRDVMGSGGGSSFDGNKYAGCADKMKVLERYKGVKLPSIPDNLLRLNEELFGDIYE